MTLHKTHSNDELSEVRVNRPFVCLSGMFLHHPSLNWNRRGSTLPHPPLYHVKPVKNVK